MPPITLSLAVILYALLSHPAPQTVRWVEATVGALLLLTVGLWRPFSLATGRAAAMAPDPWSCAMALSFVWLLWAPLLRGVGLVGWETVPRDVASLLFLFLPLFLVPVLRPYGERAVRLLTAAVILAGVLFALRWWRQNGWAFPLVGVVPMSDGIRYFLNAPSVLFAGLALPQAAVMLATRGGPIRWAGAAVALAGGVLCLGALAGAVHRMALVLGLLGLAAAGVRALRGGRLRGPVTALVAAGMLALFLNDTLGGTLGGTWERVLEKSRHYGVNARGAELAAVFTETADSPWSLLLGQGWGALLANPAVGGWRVSYTHTLVGYALFKGGVLGLAALLVYLAGLGRALPALIRDRPFLAASVLPPLAVALGLHTSYKYLDCGVLLTLAVLAAEPLSRPPLAAPPSPPP